MFAFFGINGVVDLLLQKRWILPPKLDYVTAALAYAVEGFLFAHHLHGRTHMDIQVRTEGHWIATKNEKFLIKFLKFV